MAAPRSQADFKALVSAVKQYRKCCCQFCGRSCGEDQLEFAHVVKNRRSYTIGQIVRLGPKTHKTSKKILRFIGCLEGCRLLCRVCHTGYDAAAGRLPTQFTKIVLKAGDVELEVSLPDD